MLRRALAAAAALTAPGIALTVVSERLIRPRLFYSGAWHPEPPDAVRWPYEEARIFTADGLELQGWYFPAVAPGSPVILFCHGTSYNASDMWITEERAQAFQEFLAGIRASFLLFDYRGYGRNPGTPSEEGTYADAAGALAWLYQRQDIDPARIFYYGFSMGTGVAAELAVREPLCAGLILRAPFTSIRAMATARYPWMATLLALGPWLPLTNYDTLSKIRRLRSPLLVMHGDADLTVPEWMGQRVFEAAPEPKTYVSFPASGHSDISAELVVPPITRFMDGVLGRTPPHAAAPAALVRRDAR
jgi:fermentation-respiration switch protein FrsA (DUF1100 family)